MVKPPVLLPPSSAPFRQPNGPQPTSPMQHKPAASSAEPRWRAPAVQLMQAAPSAGARWRAPVVQLMQAAGHAQGEHVFNAVHDLAEQAAVILNGMINNNADPMLVQAATQAIQNLRAAAEAFGEARDNAQFHTADDGDPANASRYGQLSSQTLRLIGGWRGASGATAGYIGLNRILNDLEYYCVDITARNSRRGALPNHQRGAFDAWVVTTTDLMYDAYRAIREAALAMGRTLN